MKKRTHRSKLGRKNLIKYIQDYRFNSILVKNLITILVVLLCVFTLIMTLVTYQMNRSISEEVGRMSINTLDKTQERMDTVMKEVVLISGHMSLDSDVVTAVMPDMVQILETSAIERVLDKITTQVDVIDYIDSIYIYSSKNNYIITGEGVEDFDTFQDVNWYSNLTERIYEPGRMITREKVDGLGYYISYIQPLRLTQLEFLGGIIINVDINKLDELVISNKAETNENLLIVDERNNVLFSSNENDLLHKLGHDDYLRHLSIAEDGYRLVDDEMGEMIATVSSSEYFKWKYISLVPLSMYDSYRASFRQFSMLLILLIVLLAISASVFISFYSYKPVMNILNLLKNPNMYKERFEMDESFRKDEAEEIGLNIIRNIYSNQQLHEEMVYYMNTIDKAHVTALQAQLSPHFLFNTLENIRWRVMDELDGDNEITDSILKLSDLLRLSINDEQQIIPLREEIQNTKLYVDILQLRYEDKVSIVWQVDDKLLDCRIVKVSLQPLIENAVYHGIKPLRKKGIINVIIRSEDQRLIIEIQDNGVGMDAATLIALNDDLTEKYILKGDHIGIRNVNQRIKLLMGDDASMRIESQEGVGTKITISTPMIGE